MKTRKTFWGSLWQLNTRPPSWIEHAPHHSCQRALPSLLPARLSVQLGGGIWMTQRAHPAAAEGSSAVQLGIGVWAS